MKNYKNLFKNKKITIMGLGLLGRGLGYTKFLAECGANLIVTDLKTKEQLATSIQALSKFPNIKYTLGEHKLEDFRNRDIVMKMAGVPKDSVYIEEAKKTGAQIEMDVSLLCKSSPEVVLVGVTGTRGKSMTTQIIYEVLKNNESFLKKKVFLGGNVRGVATLPMIKKIQKGDILVCELDSWQLQGFGDARISPHISVFTSFMPDHMNYYKNNLEDYFNDKANIFNFQTEKDFLIIRPEVKKLIPKGLKAKLIVAKPKEANKYNFIVPGKYQRENLAAALEVVRLFKIPETKIKKAVKDFRGLPGRLEFLRNIKGAKVFNDNNATTPEATIAGIEAMNTKRNIILISGGSDKTLDLNNLVTKINSTCKVLVLLPGTGTEKLLEFDFKVPVIKVKDLKESVKEAVKVSRKGDIILFSPAFASFGMFNNEYERNDLFVKLIKKIK